MATRSSAIYQTPEQCAADPIAVANGLEPGDFIYEDVNGDHVIDGNDKQVLGSYVPSFTYGFNAGFSYKNFDFSLTTYGQAGGELWNRKRALRYAAGLLITLTAHSMRTAGRVQALPTNIRRPRLFSKPGTNQTVTTLPIS